MATIEVWVDGVRITNAFRVSGQVALSTQTAASFTLLADDAQVSDVAVDLPAEVRIVGASASKSTWWVVTAVEDTIVSDGEEAADYHIFDDGFTSRTIFIFEREPRYYSYELPERSDDQVKAFRELLPWIKSLAGLFGRINYSEEAKQFLIDTCDRDHKALVAKAGPKMQSYLGRRGVMIKKIAAALHFSESLSLDIPVERFAEAIEFLKPLEANMQGGFSVVGRNELHPYSNMIRNHLKFASGASTAELLSIFASDLSAEELNEVLTGLVMAEQVDIRGSKYYAK